MAVVTSDQFIAGRYYYKDPYTCQSCPDTLMKMSVSSKTYSCHCPTTYTEVGVLGIGDSSCVLTTLTAPHKNEVQVASQVTYYGTEAAGTITSLTFEHYYLKAVSKCEFYGTPDDTVYCHQLANLCVLALYDDTAQACIAFKSIVALRGVNIFDNVVNWALGMPWLYFGGEAATVCTTYAHKKRVTLNALQVRVAIACVF